MMRYGIPNYRIPRDKLAGEIQRIIDMGEVDVRTGVRVGKDVTVEQLEKDFDAILWAVGCWTGRGLLSLAGKVPRTACPASRSSRPSTKAA